MFKLLKNWLQSFNCLIKTIFKIVMIWPHLLQTTKFFLSNKSNSYGNWNFNLHKRCLSDISHFNNNFSSTHLCHCFFFSLLLIECPLESPGIVFQPHGARQEMIKSKNMLISINKNLIKFSTCLERNFSLSAYFATARWINFSFFTNVSDFHYSRFYFHRVYFEFPCFSSIVNCNFRFHVNDFFRRLHTKIQRKRLAVENEERKWFITHRKIHVP